ncbi:hypothetical protein C2845_PM06G18890 [Panicum miliaceum]|uniref:pyruvate decarboxylase n=1 Tax=Panicum miliaceum TaxID=4540 RepID=A0A3L6RBA9_PANMI|nr:hypothetical protein C2845_PM06G18890 [Panicum miliaceum]
METLLVGNPANGVAKPMCNGVGALPVANYHAVIAAPPPAAVAPAGATLGRHLARRLVQIGASDVFAVPGDFNLTLLDYLIAEPGLNLVGCCNELNAGYAADGYARSRGVGACAVTFTVGGLSVLNAIAGACSENLPVICIVGGPNSNDYGTNRVLHHTIGLPDFSQELRCFQAITCYQAVVNNLDDAHEQIDTAIATALRESKPVYISVSCNLAGLCHPTFSREPVPLFISPRLSNKANLEYAVEAAAEFLNKAVKPVMVGGPRIRVAKAKKAFAGIADASGYPFAVMPSAKGLVPEHHPRFIGTYWGAVSTSFCAEIVESADAYLFAGPIFNDYSSVGYSLLLKREKAVIVQPDRVVVGNGPAFGCILMGEFLRALSRRLRCNTTAYDNYRRIFVPDREPLNGKPDEPLRVNILFKHIKDMLSGDTAVVAETGDSWFNCQKLRLPEGCGYVRVSDAVRVDRVVGRRDARVRPGGQGQARHRVHRRRKLSGDGAGRVDDAAVRAAERHLPHQQRRVHHRGGDPRRPVQCDQELGLHGPGRRHPQLRRQLLDQEGPDGGGAQGGDRDGDGRQEGLPLLHRGDRAQGRHEQGAPRVGLQGIGRQQQAAEPAVIHM